MASVNKVIILGNLGKDPEVRHTADGTAVANFSVATSFKPKGGEEKVEWHRVTAWGRLGEIAGEYLQKGRPVYVEGRLETRKWQDKEGNDRYSTDVIAERLQLIGGQRQDDEGAEEEVPERRPARSGSAKSAPAKSAAGNAKGRSPIADMSDDIPF